MISETGDPLFDDIEAAKQTVAQAEHAVNALIERLASAPRASKVTVSAPLEAALQRLRDARAILDELHTDTQDPGIAD